MTITGHSLSQLIDQEAGGRPPHRQARQSPRPLHRRRRGMHPGHQSRHARACLPLRPSASATSSATFGATASSTHRIPSWMSRSLSITSTGLIAEIESSRKEITMTTRTSTQSTLTACSKACATSAAATSSSTKTAPTTPTVTHLKRVPPKKGQQVRPLRRTARVLRPVAHGPRTRRHRRDPVRQGL
jgi:hypothetical protein